MIAKAPIAAAPPTPIPISGPLCDSGRGSVGVGVVVCCGSGAKPEPPPWPVAAWFGSIASCGSGRMLVAGGCSRACCTVASSGTVVPFASSRRVKRNVRTGCRSRFVAGGAACSVPSRKLPAGIASAPPASTGNATCARTEAPIGVDRRTSAISVAGILVPAGTTMFAPSANAAAAAAGAGGRVPCVCCAGSAAAHITARLAVRTITCCGMVHPSCVPQPARTHPTRHQAHPCPRRLRTQAALR